MAATATREYSPCSTAHRAPIIGGRTRPPPRLTTLHSRYRSLISHPKKKRLEALGLQVETAEHVWVHWRSL
jgi:hypothetical protein